MMNSEDSQGESGVEGWRGPGRVLVTVLFCIAVVLAGPGGAKEVPGEAETGGGVSTDVCLGAVRVDARGRCISFPVAVNQRTGLVEYVLVTGTGKTHESVLRTDAEPQHIHLGLLLLGARPAGTPLFPSDGVAPPPGEPVRIEVLWTVREGEVTRPVEDLVVTTNRWQSLDRGPWVYNGSYLSDRVFVAQREGSIVALQVDPAALVNNPRPGRDNDELHYANGAALPPEDTPLTVRIRLGRPAAGSKASPGSALLSTTPASPQ